MTDEGSAETDPGHVGEGRAWDVAERVAGMLEIVQRFASLDFSVSAPVGEDGDDLDALGAGINMLGEELEASQLELEERVRTRTEELTELARRLEREVAERRGAEERVEQANAELNAWVDHLRWLNDRVEQLTEMGNLLQVAGDRQEAFAILGQVGPAIFSGTHGDVFVFVPSRDMLERVTSWGDLPGEPTIEPDDCWALRRGRVHRVDAGEGLRCAHLQGAPDAASLCVPLTAQGEILGLLNLGWERAAPTGLTAEDTSEAGSVRVEHERLAVVAAEQFALALSNLELRAALRAQSIRDPLTGLFNRRYLDETLQRELARADREGTPAAVLMLDIDRFKGFNDSYGHAAGDAVLCDVARLLREAIRVEDVACRYGGEELAIVLTGIDEPFSVERAEQIREAIASTSFTWQGQSVGNLTVSIGVACFPVHARGADELVRAADAALYEAKRGGRDRVEVARPEVR